ncbi:MAG: V-type ATP synthase subunit B [Promethearchaeia archaeon]
MSVIYKRIREIVGPLVFLKNKHRPKYGEIVKIKTNDKIRTGEVVRMDEDIIVLEVFEDTTGLSSENSEVIFTNESFKLSVSEDMLGHTFNSLGQPIDISTKRPLDSSILTGDKLDINSSPINPFGREYPSVVIQTGVSVIDGLFTLIRGQNLPIFSGQGLPHNKLAAQIVTQAKVLSGEPFLIIFCGIGIIQDEARYFAEKFKEGGNIKNIISFINFADDPIMERLIIPRVALTTAEYFAFEKDMHVLVVLVDITNYAEALRELSAAKEEIPSKKGYPGYLYSDLASLYERTGKIKNKKGSITQIPILTMPNDDISHPVPDTTRYITEGQLVFDRDLDKKGIYPPFEVISSISRLMKDAIGEKKTREDHSDIASQILASYSDALEVRDLISIVGEEGLNREQKFLLDFADAFENEFLDQDQDEDRSFTETFDLAWNVLSVVPKEHLNRIHQDFIRKYYTKRL